MFDNEPELTDDPATLGPALEDVLRAALGPDAPLHVQVGGPTHGQPAEHSRAYRTRRFLNWFPLGLTYATFYMGRYNLNVSSKTMMDHFHLSKAEFGMIATAGFWTYALSVIFNGPLADRIGGKKAILIGAAGAAVAQPGRSACCS